MASNALRARTRHPRLRRLTCYFGVGASLGVADFLLFAALTLLFQFPPILANVICTSVTSTASFYLNGKLVFKEANAHILTFFGYIGVTLVSAYIVQNLALSTVLRLVHISALLTAPVILSVGKVVAQILGSLTNFVGYSFVFRCIAPHDKKLLSLRGTDMKQSGSAV